MSDLFGGMPETLSPREQWIEDNGITVIESPHLTDEEDPWAAWLGTMDDYVSLCRRLEEEGKLVTGKSRDEVLTRLAASLYRNCKIKPWNMR